MTTTTIGKNGHVTYFSILNGRWVRGCPAAMVPAADLATLSPEERASIAAAAEPELAEARAQKAGYDAYWADR